MANQRQAIDTILSDLEGNEGYVVMDYKMKFEAMYYREKTADFYGKKGSSWHGAMIYSRYTSDQIQAHATESDAPLQPHHMYPLDSRPKHTKIPCIGFGTWFSHHNFLSA